MKFNTPIEIQLISPKKKKRNRTFSFFEWNRSEKKYVTPVCYERRN